VQLWEREKSVKDGENESKGIGGMKKRKNETKVVK
jgi:hypothetical protein